MKKSVIRSARAPKGCPAPAKAANRLKCKVFGPPTWPEAVAAASNDPSVLRRANYLASEYGVEASDLLQAACCRALSYPPPCSARARLKNCMRSIAWTMWRNRRTNYTLPNEADDEEYALFSKPLSPDEDAQRSWANRVILHGFAAIAGNDNEVGQFIDVVCDGYRGQAAQTRLGLSQKQFETVKRRAQRKIRKHFQPHMRSGRIELDWLLSTGGHEIE